MRVVVCESHGEYSARVMMIAGVERQTGCPQCIEARNRQIELEASIESNLTKRSTAQRKWVDLFGHAGIPPRYMRQGFGTYVAQSPEQHAALRVAMEYAEQFADRKADGRGLLFVGSSGTGKTHLAAAICKAVMKQGYGSLFTSTLEMCQVVKESYRDHETSERKAIQRFVEPDLLVLDEVGVQHQSKTEWVILTDLVNRRYSQNRPIIMISNLDLDEIGELLGFRIADRLREVCEVVVCDWESYRRRSES